MLAARESVPEVVEAVPAAPGASGLAARVQYPLLALALAFFLILGWRGREPIHIGTTDENTYLMLSRSLESGSYRESFLGTAPLHVKYPPGYPAFLVGVRLVGGENLDVIRAVNLLLLAGSIVLLYLVVRRVAGVAVALSAAFLLAINHALLNAGGTVLSESLFIGLATAALYCTVRADAGRSRWAYWAVALVLASFLTRTAGIAFVAAIGVWLLGRRRPPELLAYALASLVVVGGWLAYAAMVPDQAGGKSYGMDIAAGLRGAPESHPALRFIYTALRNVAHYGVRTFPTLLGVPTVGGTSIDNVAWLGVNAALIPVGAFVLWKRARAAAAYLVFYGGLLVAWPWLQARVVVPLIPLALVALLIGAYHLTRLLPAPARHAAFAALVLLLGFGGLKATLQRDAQAQKCDRSNPYESEGCLDPVTRGAGRAALFIRANTPPDAVVLTLEGAGVNYVSGRLTELPNSLWVPPDQVLQRLSDLRIQYIMLSGHNERMVRLAQVLLPSCREFRVAGRFGDGVILLTTGIPGLTSEDGCVVLGTLASLRSDQA